MSNQSDTAGFMAMKGAGYYSKATTGARDVINAAAPLIIGGGRPHPARRCRARLSAAPISAAPMAAPLSRCGGACSATSAPASPAGPSRSSTPICRATISASFFA